MANFYGKTLDEFYESDYDYFRDDNLKGGGFGRKPNNEIIGDVVSGGGPRSAFFRDLRAAGVPREKYNFYADKAGIKNVNSDNDIADIIAAYEADIARSERTSSDSEEMEDDTPVEFAPTPREEKIEKNRPYLDRIADNNRLGISNYVIGASNPRRNVFNKDGSVKSDDDMRNPDKDEESMDFVNRYKAKVIDQLNRYDRAIG